MALPRIRVDREQADLVQKLLDTTGTTGVFQTYADIVIFAATVGMRHQKKFPYKKYLKVNQHL